MMRFMMALAAGSMLISSAAMAQSARAPGGFYVGGSIGTATFWDNELEVNGVDRDVEYDALGFVFAGQVGYFLTDNIRIEAELAYQSTEGEVEFNGDQDIEVTTLRGSISGYYDFASFALAGSSFRPYGGGGVGFMNFDPKVDNVQGEDDSTELALQGEVGASYDLSPNFALVPAVRLEYASAPDDFDSSTIVSLFKVGVRFAP